MSNFCTNCGQSIQPNAKFCPHCGMQLNNKATTPNSDEDENASVENQTKTASIDETSGTQTKQEQLPIDLNIKNKQNTIANRALLFGFVFLFFIYLTFSEGNPLSGLWAIGLIGIFGLVTSIVVYFIFKSRSRKMKSLVSGASVIASWQMSEELKNQYVNHLYEHESAKNKGIFFITSLLIVVIFGIFILVIDDGKGAMAAVMIGLIGLIALFAFGMPHFYRMKNAQADGKVLIGKKFAYINGFFHNWDFPLSGIKKSKIINEPFYGLYIQYYYTDRTFTNTEELHIPAPREVELNKVIQILNN